MPTKDEREPSTASPWRKRRICCRMTALSLSTSVSRTNTAPDTSRGATLIPVNSVFARREELPKDKKIVFVCEVGQRSALAAELAAAAGLPADRLYRPRWWHRRLEECRRTGRGVVPQPASAVAVIVLWDIDNTLLYTGGAGSVAMTRAFHDLYGINDAFGRVEFSGRSDTAILLDAMRLHGVAEDPASQLPRFIDAYVPHIERALIERAVHSCQASSSCCPRLPRTKT